MWNLTTMFLSTWNVDELEVEDFEQYRHNVYLPDPVPTDGMVQPFMDSPLDDEEVSATVFINLISRANRYIYLTTPYLIIDHSMNEALCAAAKAGVDVRIITPHIPDKRYVYIVTRANYDLLLEAGVRIFEYTPGFVHSKVCFADGLYAVVGTVNLDFRSLYLHFENAVYLYDCAAVGQVERDFEDTFPRCREVTFARMRHKGVLRRLAQTILRLFSPLM